MTEKKKRLRYQIEFNPNNEDDLELWKRLQQFSSPVGYIKDVLKGIMPPLYAPDYKVYTNMIKFEEIDEE